MAQDETVQRRLKAARALAGVTVVELAARINEAGLGPGTLGSIERGERDVQRSELVVIAEACGLPYEFFTADLENLGATGGDILERLDRIAAGVSQLLDQRQADPEQALATAVGRIVEGVRATVLETSVQKETATPPKRPARRAQ